MKNYNKILAKNQLNTGAIPFNKKFAEYVYIIFKHSTTLYADSYFSSEKGGESANFCN